MPFYQAPEQTVVKQDTAELIDPLCLENISQSPKFLIHCKVLDILSLVYEDWCCLGITLPSGSGVTCDSSQGLYQGSQ